MWGAQTQARLSNPLERFFVFDHLLNFTENFRQLPTVLQIQQGISTKQQIDLQTVYFLLCFVIALFSSNS